jgi:hypothetical protein
MTSDETYNGWTNRETWAFNLWFGDDENLNTRVNDVHKHVLVEARADYPEHPDWAVNAANSAAADEARDWYAEVVDEFGTEDGVRAAINEIGSEWRIDWHETAHHIVEG